MATNDPTTTPDAPQFKSNCLQDAYDHFNKTGDRQHELEHYVSEAPTLTRSELDSKLRGILQFCDTDNSGVAEIVSKKINLLLKSI